MFLYVIKIYRLNGTFTASAGFAVAAAFFTAFSRRGKHFPAITSFHTVPAVRAVYGFVVFFYKLFEALFAVFTNILKYWHNL